MTPNAESLYLTLRELAATMPNFEAGEWATPAGRLWLARTAAILEVAGIGNESFDFRFAADSLGTPTETLNVHRLPNIVLRALARAELRAPQSLQGQFIASGDTLSAFNAVAKVFARAKSDLLLVDAYADHSVITDFVVTAPEQVNVRILAADKEARKQAIRPAVERWHQQFPSRPLSVRVVPAASLHDRLILVDGSEVWTPGQSFNGMAQRSHTSIPRVDAALAAQKVAAYELLWIEATPLA